MSQVLEFLHGVKRGAPSFAEGPLPYVQSGVEGALVRQK